LRIISSPSPSPIKGTVVLDPFSALSLTGDIVQFVDFSIKVVDRISKVYRSSTGLTDEDLELLTSAQTLKHDAQALSHSPLLDNADATNQKSLRELTAACDELSDDLINQLNDLRVREPSRKRARILQGIRAASRKSTVHDLVSRMSRLRDTLNTHLIVMPGCVYINPPFLHVMMLTWAKHVKLGIAQVD
jgi:hypothetical protein